MTGPNGQDGDQQADQMSQDDQQTNGQSAQGDPQSPQADRQAPPGGRQGTTADGQQGQQAQQGHQTGFSHPRLQGKDPEEVDRLFATMEETVRKQGSQLNQMASQGQQGQQGQQTDDSDEPEISNEDFFDRPVDAISQAIERQVAPIREQVQGMRMQDEVEERKRQYARKYPRWNENEPYMEAVARSEGLNYEQILANPNVVDLLYNAVENKRRSGELGRLPNPQQGQQSAPAPGQRGQQTAQQSYPQGQNPPATRQAPQQGPQMGQQGQQGQQGHHSQQQPRNPQGEFNGPPQGQQGQQGQQQGAPNQPPRQPRRGHPQAGQQGQPPQGQQPQQGQQGRRQSPQQPQNPPPQHRPDASPLPRGQQGQQGNEGPSRQLNEAEERLRQEYGMTREEFIRWQEMDSREVATADRPGQNQ